MNERDVDKTASLQHIEGAEDVVLHGPLGKLYRLVELVGRWSMLDVYVVAILAALVQFRPLATVTPRSGAVYFGAVVVLSMLSAMAFDPRLIWDPAHKESSTHA